MFDYTIERNPRRKRISVKVTSENKVVALAPIKAKVKDIQAYIQSQKKWITNVLKRQEASVWFSKPFLSGDRVLFAGREYPVVYDGTVGIDETQVHLTKLNDFKRLLLDSLKDEFLQHVKKWQQVGDFHVKSIRFASTIARWGSCSASHALAFNFKLLMLDKMYWDSVIVHELCHTIYFDHSKNFKNLVLKIYPEYEKIHDKLNNYYGFVCRSRVWG